MEQAIEESLASSRNFMLAFKYISEWKEYGNLENFLRFEGYIITGDE